MTTRPLTALLALLISSPAVSQGLLPKGVGFYQFGYRVMPLVDEQFNSQGEVTPVGERFAKRFDGAYMQSGRAGKDLQKLTTVLSEFEGGATGPGSMAGDLQLGRLNGDVTASVEARIFALGFGVTKGLTVFAGLPFVQATVRTALSFDRTESNAEAMASRMGEAAFTDLQDGLVRAARMDEATVKQSLLDAGYQPIDRWSHAGIGDLTLGARTAHSTRLSRATGYTLAFTTTVELPTGYVERPDVLTDVSFGKGYPAVGLLVDQTMRARMLLCGVDAFYGINLPTRMEKRVPEGLESTVIAERTHRAHLNPGDDAEAGVYTGLKLGWITPRYRFAQRRHFGDRYKGSLEGNYAELSANSDSVKTYHDVSLALDSTKAYRRGRFALPFVLTARAHLPVAGRNATIQRWYEVGLMSFFSTPWASR